MTADRMRPDEPRPGEPRPDEPRPDVVDEGSLDESVVGDTTHLDLFVARTEGDIDWDRVLSDHPQNAGEIAALRELDSIRSAYSHSRPRLGDLLEDERERSRPESASAGAAEPEHKVGRYRILECIGSGGTASVYRARDDAAGRDVALKIIAEPERLSHETLARFLREARALATLDHRNIIRIHHVIEEGDELGICMEHVDGDSLEEWLVEHGPLDIDEVRRIGRELAEALSAVHDAGYVHRDVKASNVLRERRTGRIVLTDFGITRAITAERKVTSTGVIVGTPVAMAPEQYLFGEANERTDIYSLGCLLYHLLTGRQPVSGGDVTEIRDRVLHAKFPRVEELRSRVPASLAATVATAMHPDPAKRFSSATELARGLEAGDAPSRPTHRLPSWVPWLLVLLLSIAILLLVIDQARR